MRTISFFNEKGGSGKSTFCLMMASWLRYRCGRSVAVIDLDDPMHSIYEIRQIDLEAFREGGRHLMSFVPGDADPDRDWYPVITAKTDAGEGDQRLMESLIRSMEGEYDYVIVDFGGSFGEGDTVVRFLRSHLLDLMVVPVYSDETVVLSALELCYRASLQGQRRAAFWNRTTRSERATGGVDRLSRVSTLFTREGTPVLRTKIPDMQLFRRDCRTWRFLRSTACWPQANIDALCPELETLFAEVLSLLDEEDNKKDR